MAVTVPETIQSRANAGERLLFLTLIISYQTWFIYQTK